MKGRGQAYVNSRRFPIPEEIAHQISLRGLRKVKDAAPKGEKQSYRHIRATWRRGAIGVHFPPSAVHLFMLNEGIRPFIMHALDGKVIPIRGQDGVIHFRTAKDPGKPKITVRDERGRIVQSKIRWRHPGVAPMNYIEPALAEGILDWAAEQTNASLVRLLQRVNDAQVEAFFRQFQTARPLPRRTTGIRPSRVVA